MQREGAVSVELLLQCVCVCTWAFAVWSIGAAALVVRVGARGGPPSMCVALALWLGLGFGLRLGAGTRVAATWGTQAAALGRGSLATLASPCYTVSESRGF